METQQNSDQTTEFRTKNMSSDGMNFRHLTSDGVDEYLTATMLQTLSSGFHPFDEIQMAEGSF